ncbi:MAG: ATP-binding protein [Sumerlaeia bacterium]
MSLKARFFLLTLIFLSLTAAFCVVLSRRNGDLRSARHHIEDDWIEIRHLLELEQALNYVHGEIETNGVRTDRALASGYLQQAVEHSEKIRDHAQSDLVGESGERDELTALAALETNLERWQQFLDTATFDSSDIREMNELHKQSMLASNLYSRGALRELEGSIGRLDRTEDLISALLRNWSVGMIMLLVFTWAGFGIWLIRPIRNLRTMVAQVRARQYDAITSKKATGEIGEVILSVQEMAQEIQSFTTGLEQRVHERTRELEASRHQLRTMLDHLPDAVGLVGPGNRVLMANETYHLLFGENGSSPAASLRQAPRTPHGYFLWEDEHAVSYVLDAQSFELPGGEDGDTIVLEHIRDMTRQTGVERALASSQKLAAIGRIASGMAHEINNPLTAIGACAEGLMRRIDRPELDHETFRDYLRTIRDEVFRCKEITEGLLDLSRQRGQALINCSPSAIITEIVRLVAQLADKKGIDLVWNEAGELEIITSPSALRQIVLNLTLNAIEACEEDGRIEFHLEPENDQLVLTIEDNGRGIRGEDLPQIFEPFFSRRRDESGTGLGLYVCQSLADAIGGVLSAESAGLGQGALFALRLPLTSRQAAGPIDHRFESNERIAHV